MTPEERERAINFIIESQARLAAAQEQDRHDRLAFEKWASNLSRRIANLIEVESQRLDRQDEMIRDARREYLESQKKNELFQREGLDLQKETLHLQRETIELQKEALRLLHQILNRLTGNANPNLN